MLKFLTRLNSEESKEEIEVESFKDLLEEIVKNYQGKIAERFHLKYLDEEKDQIMLSNQEDFDIMVEYAQETL